MESKELREDLYLLGDLEIGDHFVNPESNDRDLRIVLHHERANPPMVTKNITHYWSYTGEKNWLESDTKVERAEIVHGQSTITWRKRVRDYETED